VERYLSAADAAAVRAVEVGLWSLDPCERTPAVVRACARARMARAPPSHAGAVRRAQEAAIADAIAHPHAYVLKPQREGGGNNKYDEGVWAQLLCSGVAACALWSHSPAYPFSPAPRRPHGPPSDGPCDGDHAHINGAHQLHATARGAGAARQDDGRRLHFGARRVQRVRAALPATALSPSSPLHMWPRTGLSAPARGSRWCPSTRATCCARRCVARARATLVHVRAPTPPCARRSRPQMRAVSRRVSPRSTRPCWSALLGVMHRGVGCVRCVLPGTTTIDLLISVHCWRTHARSAHTRCAHAPPDNIFIAVALGSG
jgi:hypothetical protein